VGVNGRAWLDTAGHEHSDKLRLTERVKREGDEINWTVTFGDPIFFERPWSITRTFTRAKPADRILPYTCTENNKAIEHLTPNQPNLGYKRPVDNRAPLHCRPLRPGPPARPPAPGSITV
jgi:hypothetical protein